MTQTMQNEVMQIHFNDMTVFKYPGMHPDKENFSITIWRSNNYMPLEKFKKDWPNHKFLTVVRTENNGKVDEELGYEAALSLEEVFEQIEIYKKSYEKKQAGTVHSKELLTYQDYVERAIYKFKTFFEKRFGRR